MQEKQRCPLCGLEVQELPRYPRYVCHTCARKATSADHRPLAFFNEGFSGGFVAQYSDTGERYPSHICTIDGIECYANEARFGGIVIQVST